MGVINRREREEKPGKRGFGVVLEKTNESHEVEGIFAEGKTVRREDFSVGPRREEGLSRSRRTSGT
jgi:hypothetical protein